MKTIESKDLVIGQEYYDIPDMDLKNATVLRFVRTYNGLNCFTYVRGNKDYRTDYISFPTGLNLYQP